MIILKLHLKNKKMRKSLLIICILLSTSIYIQATEVQSLVVQSKTSSESVNILSGVRKIIFSGGTMSVVKKDATQRDYTLNNVQKLLFALRSTSTEISEVSVNNLTAYPNPSTNLLFVEGVSSEDNVHLYDLKGNELKIPRVLVNNILQINTSTLPQGLYLLQVNNQTIKFQKQ
jgi:hypothetical protein